MKPKVALVLSGGGATASYEAGALEVFKEHGISYDIVTGVSAGALNAVAVVAGHIDRLRPLWSSMTRNKVYEEPRFGLLRAYLTDAPAVYRTAPLRSLIEREVDFSAIRRSPIQLRIVCCDLRTGEKRIFDNKMITPDILMATTAIPVLFPTIEHGNDELADGGILSNAPIGAAIAAGADVVICIVTVPKKPPVRTREQLSGLANRLGRTAELIIADNMRGDIARALDKNMIRGRKYIGSFVLWPSCPLPAGLLDFEPEKVIPTIAQGEADARKFFLERPNFNEELNNYDPPRFRFVRERFATLDAVLSHFRFLHQT